MAALTLLAGLLGTGLALAGAPDTANAQALMAKATEQKSAGKLEQAIATLQAAVQADPKLTQAWVMLGGIQLSVGRSKQAAASFKTALQLDPGLTDVRYNLAFTLRQTGDYKGAVATYRAYLKTAPKDPDAVYGLAESLKGDAQWLAAAEAFELYAETEKRPNQSKWVSQARVEARQLREKAGAPAKPEPADPAAVPTVGALGVLAETGAAAPAATAEPVPEPEPVPPVALPSRGDRSTTFRAGLIDLRNNDFVSALPRLQQAAQEEPEDPVVLSALGAAYLGTRDAAKAAQAYRQALALDPPPAMLPPLRFGLAEAQRLNGDSAAALAGFKQVAADEATSDALKTLAGTRVAELSR